MKEGKELYDLLAQAYERNSLKERVSPSWLATEAMAMIGFTRDMHSLVYIGCHLQLRAIARQFCNQKFDPPDDARQHKLFPELQARYALKVRENDEPTYVFLENLPDADLTYNVEQFRQRGNTLLQHADALEQYGKERRGKPETAAA